MHIERTDVANDVAPIVHLYILLDRSGSMESMVGSVLEGFNGLLDKQLADGPDARVTLVQFDSHDPHEVIADGVPIVEMVPLTAQVFEPRGGTPLLDATGRMIGRAAAHQAALVAQGLPPEQVVMVTITDGEENQSSEFTRKQLVKLVTAKTGEGWSFVYVGAGIDAYRDAQALGYDARSVQAWAPDATGAGEAFASVSMKTQDLRRKVRGRELIDAADFFEGDKPAEADRKRRGT